MLEVLPLDINCAILFSVPFDHRCDAMVAFCWTDIAGDGFVSFMWKLPLRLTNLLYCMRITIFYCHYDSQFCFPALLRMIVVFPKRSYLNFTLKIFFPNKHSNDPYHFTRYIRTNK